MVKNIRWPLLLGTILILILSSPSVPDVHAQAGSASEIFRLVNQLRAGYGLPPFTWDNSLSIAAQNHANYMATNNIYSHSGANGSNPASRAIAAGYPGYATENIVGGTDLTPSQGVTWWKNSSTHFNTIISNRYIHAGVGFAQGHEQNFYVLVVGVPQDQSPNPPPQVEIQGEALAPVAPIQLAPPREDGSVIHVVGAGQSFWAIAARYEISLDQLYLYNNLDENSVINPGDELLIQLAEGQLPPPTPTPPATHKVSAGDSLWTIAAWYNLGLDDLLWLNSMEEDSHLSPGDEIKIRLLPGEEPPATATPQVMYVVRSGDTAWGIAQEYELSVDELLSYNDMSQNSILSVGDQLLVVPPSPTPTMTPKPTFTPIPPPTPTPTLLPSPTAIADAVQISSIDIQPSPAALSTENNEDNGHNFSFAAMIILGFVLIGAGAIAISFIKRPS